eukprot:15469262-Alexandrium_andersonii.AAC.1
MSATYSLRHALLFGHRQRKSGGSIANPLAFFQALGATYLNWLPAPSVLPVPAFADPYWRAIGRPWNEACAEDQERRRQFWQDRPEAQHSWQHPRSAPA